MTAIRAKRLLGEFENTALAVRLHAPAALVGPLSGDHPGDTDWTMAAHAEEYCTRHADLLLAPSDRVTAYARERNGRVRTAPYPVPSTDPAPDASGSAARHVVYAGPLDPLGGADVFLTAALRLARTNPDLRFTLFGPRTDRHRLGLPYVDRLLRRIPTRLRDRILVREPADMPDRKCLVSTVARHFSLCVRGPS
ncbi:hypothetical protein ACO0M4_28220 [Streptomyces sp. RGM 3693]|uniref:hypothetical protein n=1 Tax=Streptomyces sp. RGM 3693 TaxID=3413284 RepID=UPI003D2E48A5